jgi:hypothetical protein
MASRPALLPRGQTIGLGLAFSFATLGVAQKYAGTPAAVLLLAAGPVVGYVAALALEWAGRAFSPAAADVLAAVVLAAAVVALVVVYPHADTHGAGQGTDRDDAATIGARGFLHGRNPYGSTTYLGNPISQLPTLLVVAMPFVALFGSSAYELVLWLPLLYLLWRFLARDSRVALVLLLVALASPGLLREYLTGGDLIPNTVLVTLGCVLVWRVARGSAAQLGAAVVLGVVLASRANFVLVLVPLVIAVARRRGLPAAIRTAAGASAAFAAIVVPLAVTEGGRTALSMNDKLSEVSGGAPLVLSLVTAAAVVMALGTRRWSLGAVLGQAAAVQAMLLVAVVVSSSVDRGSPDFFWLVSGYGVPVLLLALTAVASSLCEYHERP